MDTDMAMAARIFALHGALWSSDRWYRWAWYVWPAATALLILSWICIGKPAGASAGAAWGRPIAQQVPVKTQKVTAAPNGLDLELVSCFANQPFSSETACT